MERSWGFFGGAAFGLSWGRLNSLRFTALLSLEGESAREFTVDHEYAAQVIEENYSVKAISDKFKELYYEFI